MGNYTEWIFDTPTKVFSGLHCMDCGNYKSCNLFNSFYNGINFDETYIYPQFTKIQCHCYKTIYEDGATDFEDNLSSATYRIEEFTDQEELSSYHSEWTSYYDFSGGD
jgi:hypothetical protein